MADFVEMPVQGGVGPYHFNRYRIVFDKPEAMSTESLATNLITNFPFHFHSNHATVEKQKRTFGGKPTLKFHGFDKVLKNKVDLAQPHHDWVVMDPVDMRLGFTARTLRRTFIDMPDDAEAAIGGGAVGGYFGHKIGGLPGGFAGGVAGAAEALSVNQCHFLAGRRCWRLDTAKNFGLPGDRLVLETTAVERFSRTEYALADAGFGMEKLVPDIWCSLLWNFVVHTNVHADQLPLRGGWTYGKVGFNKVQYFSRPLPDLSALLQEPEFINAYCYFPTVIDLSAPPKCKVTS